MPLIRYRTGDVSRFLTEPCPCGTRLKTLERVTHRLAGRVRIGDQTLTMADLDEVVFAIEGVLNFAATVTRENNHNCLHIEIKIADGYKILSVVQAVSKAVAGLCDVDVRVSSVKDIPPSMAKRTLLDRRFSA